MLGRTREGKYRFRLTTPDVSQSSPTGEKPSAEATVELPPGELDRAAHESAGDGRRRRGDEGKFYTLANADQLLEDLPPGFRISVGIQQAPTGGGSGDSVGGGRAGSGPVTSRPGSSSGDSGIKLWNHWLIFTAFILIITAEWFFRKRKHLL